MAGIAQGEGSGRLAQPDGPGRMLASLFTRRLNIPSVQSHVLSSLNGQLFGYASHPLGRHVCLYIDFLLDRVLSQVAWLKRWSTHGLFD